MKKTFAKKIFAMAISLMLFVSFAISASALPETIAQDLGIEFYANINIPALDKTFTNDNGNIVASAANNSDAQVWHFVKVEGTDAYTIASKVDGGFVNVGDLDATLANVAIGVAEQQYIIYSLNGKYVIAPIGIEDRVIDVNGVDFNVQFWSFSEENACQQYEIVVTEMIQEAVSEEESTDESAAESTDESAVESTDESAVESTDESAVESTDESAAASTEESAAASTEESKATTSTNSSQAEEESGSAAPIVIAVIAVIVIAAVVVVVLKKKSK